MVPYLNAVLFMKCSVNSKIHMKQGLFIIANNTIAYFFFNILNKYIK